jgi:hypothetical protein
MECIGSDETHYKEIGMSLSAGLFEFVPKPLKKNLNTFVKVFSQALLDENEKVKTSAQKYN